MGISKADFKAHFKLIGEVVYLYAHAPDRHDYTIADITTDIVLPISLDQYRIYRINDVPVGFATWLYASDELLARLIHDDVVELSVEDWRSGRNIWVLDLVAPFGHGRAIARELLRDTFANARFHAMRRYPDGRARHTVWQGKNVNRNERKAG